MKKSFVLSAALIILILGMHLVAAYIVSDKIEQQLKQSSFISDNKNIAVGDVTVYPFRGNTYLNNVVLNYGKNNQQIEIQSLGADLSYRQFWSLVFRGTAAVTDKMTRLHLRGNRLTISTTNVTHHIKQVALTLSPLNRSQSSVQRNLLKNMQQACNIRLKLQDHSINLALSSSTAIQSLNPNPLSFRAITLEADWHGNDQIFKIQHISASSSQLEAEGQGEFKLSTAGNQLTASDLTHELRFGDQWVVNLSKGPGEFSGTGLNWNHPVSSGKTFQPLSVAMAGGKHNLKLQEFTWIPSSNVQQKLKSLTGGIGLPSDTLRGKNLLIDYNYRVAREKLAVRQLSFTTPSFSVQAEGTILVDSRSVGNSFVQNGEIKIHKLSEQLRSTIQQIQNFFGTSILDPSGRSIRIYVQGNIDQLQWEIM